jgi:hypothetical protein
VAFVLLQFRSNGFGKIVLEGFGGIAFLPLLEIDLPVFDIGAQVFLHSFLMSGRSLSAVVDGTR